ncbi:hypothetical protein [Paraburkholderia antibiotica]|uniref:Uncharacterized protein n=1 Tax=Paraburkholderia antibiotica TaxID=2728839 RepID=A0A7Y0A1T5_9BURK|nr:hypothetical protein [Paraburkholderia antibiotica]NML34915.1 hypothetical protein [Paraburkholderia antibiotica]
MSKAIDEVQVKQIFMLLHGMYGNSVLDKYRIGQVDEKTGEDVGMATARSVWLNGLREFDSGMVMKAIGKCAEKHKTFPPTLPEFRDLCKLFQPTKWIQQPSAPRLEMSEALRSEQAERTRQSIAQIRLRREGGVSVKPGEEGIPTLHVLIAKAVGLAGGDEIRTLMQLDERREKA